MQIPPGARRLILGVLAGVAVGGAVFLGGEGAQRPEPSRGAVVDSLRSGTQPAQQEQTGSRAAAFSPLDAPAAPLAPSQPSVRLLYDFVQPADAGFLSAALPAPSPEINYVRIDRELLTGKASPFWRKPGEGRLHLPLPRGGTLTVVIDATELLGPGRFTSIGRVEGRSGSRAVFAATGTFLHATIEDPVLGSFALRVATDDLSQFYRVDPDRVAPCGGSKQPPAALSSRAAAGLAREADAASAALFAAANPQRSEIHVMMVHSTAVLPTISGAGRGAALQSAFDHAIARVNAVFEASLITARLRLVRVHETNYNENLSAGNKVQDDALTAVQARDDGAMDEIDALRDEVGADIVGLVLQRSDSASSGLSFLLTPDRVDNDAYAYSVIHYGSMSGTNVVAHEFGHLMGCAHDRQNAQDGSGAFSYSYGYRFVGADGNQYHDIMAYPPGTEVGYFSNPAVRLPPPVNASIGIPAGSNGESNTAGTIEQTAFLTASYRLQTLSAPNPGVLINVATRAFVGQDEQVLIGGFVIGGSQAKRVLVRGAGPSLVGFGVTTALGDPVLRVFGGATQLAENDNWGGNAAVRTAAARVGAFPFSEGSADSALLVSLAPGAYTAVMEGVGAATGSGLIEVYDVERSADKIVNLSTRGYAGRNGLEMYGGFVVEGAPGSTKRILVRVLGPTLSRAPFFLTSALDDPMMELRNASGELILTSDDWSTGSDGGASSENDFRPLTQTYGEQQIFATGYAPGNRREPCILVDLAPGSYTVMVMPFEYRSSDSSRDQPAQPGVGIVEVYEINP